MRMFKLLISPKFVGFRNGLKRPRSNIKIKIVTLISAGILFWLVLFFLFYRVLSYFSSQEIIGDILARHLLAMVLLIFFSLSRFRTVPFFACNAYRDISEPLLFYSD